MIKFRPIEKSDLPLLKEYRNSDTVRPYVREYRYLNDSDQEVWYQSYLASRRKADVDQEILIGEFNDGTVFCVGGFTKIEWRNQRAEFTFYSMNRENKELILESIRSLLKIAFNEWNFHKITWPIYDYDENLELYKQIFRVEAKLQDEYYWNGEFQDRIYLSILKYDYYNRIFLTE